MSQSNCLSVSQIVVQPGPMSVTCCAVISTSHSLGLEAGLQSVLRPIHRSRLLQLMSETCGNVIISKIWARCRTFQLCLHAFRALEEPHEGPELLLSALMTSLCGVKKHDIAASLQADMLGVTGCNQSVAAVGGRKAGHVVSDPPSAVLSYQLSRDNHWTCHCAGKG